MTISEQKKPQGYQRQHTLERVLITLLFLTFLLISFLHAPGIHSVLTERYKLVRLEGFGLMDVLFLLFNYTGISLFGFCLIKPFYVKQERESFFIKLTGSFFIGYLCAIALIRLLSFIVPYPHIYFPVCVAMGLICLSLHGNRSKTRLNREHGAPNHSSLHRTLEILLCLSAFILVLLIQVRNDMGDFAWVGHGPDQYAYLLREWGTGSEKHFPIIRLHCDELIFHYFLNPHHHPRFNPIIPWWITLGVIKISSLAFFYLLFKRLKLSTLFAWTCSLFVHAGTTALNPSKYYLLFDSSNPLFFTAHSGRIVGIPLFMLLLILIVENIKGAKEGEAHIPLIFFGLTGIGISATSFSNAAWILGLISFALMYINFFPSQLCHPRQTRTFDRQNNIFIFLTVLTCLTLYSLPYSENRFLNDRTILVLFLAMLYIYRLTNLFYFPNEWHQYWMILKDNKMNLQLLTALFGIIISFLLFFNITVDNPVSKKVYARLYARQQLSLKSLPGYKDQPEQSIDKAFYLGDYRSPSRNNLYAYNQGPWDFIAYYGGILSMMLFTNFAFKLGPATKEKSQFFFREIFLMATIGIPLCFFLMDFVSFGPRAWIKSRFLEIPVYIVLFCFLYKIYTSVPKKWQWGFSALFIFYCVMPFWMTQRVHRVIRNYRIIKKLNQISRAK
ncbi:MAG: hypothetical protein K8S27_10280 [Candidatus Omnitrophica bacterium]|nr:hypothetical protein [Candidatus Omnitrophota bacterium]